MQKIEHNNKISNDGNAMVLHTIELDANCIANVQGVVLARRIGGTSGATNDSGRFTFSGAYKRSNETTTEFEAPNLKASINDQEGWGMSLAINENDGIDILVNGATDNTVEWFTRVYIEYI